MYSETNRCSCGGQNNGYTWGGAGLTSQASDYPFSMPFASHAAVNAVRLSSTRITLKTSFDSHALFSDLVFLYLGRVTTRYPLLSNTSIFFTKPQDHNVLTDEKTGNSRFLSIPGGPEVIDYLAGYQR